MKIKFYFLLFIVLLCGCSHNTNIDTIVEEHDNIVIAINKPTTGIKNIDSIINKYVNKEYKNFVKNYQNINVSNQKSELNIDYIYNIVNDKYYNIVIKKYLNSSILDKPIKEYKTLVFDKSKNRILKIKDIVSKKNYSKLISLLNNDDVTNIDDLNNFIFNDQSITFYLNSKDITIPLNDLPLKIDVKKDFKVKELYTIKENNKVIDYSRPVVALTFDDGPSKYTKEIIQFLKDNNAYATFFVLGNKINIYEDTLKTMLDNGNEIGNHSYSHKWLIKLKENELKTEIEKTQMLIKNKFNYNIKFLRPTYGSVNKMVKNNTNLEIVLWNVDTLDWKIKSSNRIVKKAINKVKNGDIILMHDTYERSLKAVKKLVPELQKQGYQFITISELREYQLINKNLESN